MRGLAERNLMFPEIGFIQIKKVHFGRERRFHFEIDESLSEAGKIIRMKYGDEGAERIKVMLPFDGLAKNFSKFYTASVDGISIAVSDGEYFLYLLDPRTMRPLAVNGFACAPIPEWGVYPDDKVKYRKIAGQDKNGVPYICQSVGWAPVMLPELRRIAYLNLRLNWENDIDSLFNHLQCVWIAVQKSMTRIPLILSFGEVPFAGKHGLTYKNSVKIEVEEGFTAPDFDKNLYKQKLNELYATGTVHDLDDDENDSDDDENDRRFFL